MSDSDREREKESERSAFFYGPSSILRDLAKAATSFVTSHIFCCLFISAIFCSYSWLPLNIHSDIKIVSLICVIRVADISKKRLSPLWTGSALSLHQIKEQTYVYNKSRSYLNYSAGTNRTLIILFASGTGGQCRAHFAADITVLVTFEMRVYGNKLLTFWRRNYFFIFSTLCI